MYDILIYEGKPATNNGYDKTDDDHLQEWAQVTAKICQNLPGHENPNFCVK